MANPEEIKKELKQFFIYLAFLVLPLVFILYPPLAVVVLVVCGGASIWKHYHPKKTGLKQKNIAATPPPEQPDA